MDITDIGFLFDLDGVLIDSHDLHWDAWSRMRTRQPALASMQYADFKNGFGQSNESFLEKFVPTSSKEQRTAWGEEKESLFRKIAEGKINFLPGIEPFLKEVRDAKIPMIIASSAPISNMEFFLHKTPLGEYFSQYTSANHVAKGKPAPDIFLEAARRLHVPIRSSIILEDSLAGLQAARNAGGFVVAIATTYTPQELQKQADFDLLLTLEQINLSSILSAFAQHN